jgi:hypothetical protein
MTAASHRKHHASRFNASQIPKWHDFEKIHRLDSP